jgi:hypothetical protein
MSVSIYRIEHHSLLNGSSSADFIEKHFPMNDNGLYYISKQKVDELNKTLRNLNPEDKETLQSLLEATNEHGDFDVSISY